MEMWKDIPGYEGLYQASNLGRIKSLERHRKNHAKLQLIKEKIKSKRIIQEYENVDLYKDGKQKTEKVHRLVALAFKYNPEGKSTVNHIDGNKLNNNADNLEWATPTEQNLHFYKKGLKSKENINKSIKAMNESNSKKVMCIETGEIYKSASEAGRQNNITDAAIRKVIYGKNKTAAGRTWKYI